MFDEQNVYANIPQEFTGEQDGQHPDEAQVPALPAPGQGMQIPTGDGNYTSPSPSPPPGAAIIPVDNSAGYSPLQQMEQWEPDDTTPEAAGRSAGLTALFVASMTGVGYALAGWKGAVAGGVLSGAVANVYRAQKNFGSTNPDQKHEAVVSSVFAVSGLGLGAYVAYEAIKDRGEYGDEE